VRIFPGEYNRQIPEPCSEQAFFNSRVVEPPPSEGDQVAHFVWRGRAQ
jgi:hypothetical protein